jgi:uncharacterized protein (TIGR02594 family)
MFAWLKNLLALFSGGQKATPVEPPKPEEPVKGEPEWLRLARAEVGQAEIPGTKDNPRILSYYAKAGFPGINDEATPWCAGFVNYCLESAGVAGSKSLAAREFLNWGKEVKKPYVGCVAVLWRVSPQSWQGHTGFVVGETATHIKLLGGNQDNKVCVKSFPKNEVLGYREPMKAGNSRTVRASTASIALAGVGGAVVLDSQTQLMGISQIVKEMGVSLPSFQLVAYLLQIIVLCIIVWARYDDLKSKGR